ncbi:LamG domain-containing protein [Kitasatospora sp. NPDC049285]|uniref:LamG domain-containing protein n=1 Tax=Kitasatospora sp. NPDC049285 TaxID=3157096 RepID=UPI0034496FAC
MVSEAFEQPRTEHEQVPAPAEEPPARPRKAPRPMPNWAKMAESYSVRRRRRRRLLVAAGALLAAGAVTSAVLTFDGGADTPAAAAVANAGTSASPPPSAPPVPLPDGAGSAPLTATGRGEVGPYQGRPGVLHLDGNSTAYAEGTVPDDAGTGFTISARVYNEASTRDRSAVSQGTAGGFSFNLGRDFTGTENHWVFEVAGPDGKVVQALGRPKAAKTTWTVLTGSYDPASGQIKLYVDGSLAASAPVAGPVRRTGTLKLGRVAPGPDGWTGDWVGAVGEVQLWSRPLADGEIGAIPFVPGSVPPAAHSWLMPPR